MADAPPQTQSKGGTFGFLTRKIGPVPIWLIAVAGFGAYYWYTHYGPGAQKTAAAATPPPRGQRPQVVVVNRGGGRGGGAGGKGGKVSNRPAPPRPARGKTPPVPQPQPAAAPMTSGAVYSGQPVSGIDGTTNPPLPPSSALPPNIVTEAGGPHGAELDGAYVPAG